MATGFTKGLLTCFLVLSCRAYCQHQTAEITECENSGCSPGGPKDPRWSFSGSHGFGHFDSGDEPLTVEHIDASSIAVRRADKSGFRALYLGRIDGQNIIGTVIYYDVNRANSPRTAVWKGILRGSPAGLTSAMTGVLPRFPFTLRECESNRCLQSGAYPITWTFPNRNGQGWLGDHPRPMIVENLTPGFLLVRRIDDSALGGLTALYFGEIDGKHVTGGVVYFDRDRPNQPRSDTWFGEIQGAFTPEEAMSASAAPGTTANNSQNKGLAGGEAQQITQATTQNSPIPANYPSPPPGVPSGRNGRPLAMDFNGDWEGYYASRWAPTAIRIHHKVFQISAELLRNDLTSTGQEFFRGEFEKNDDIFRVQVMDLNGFEAGMGVSGGNMIPGALGIMDPDHLRIEGHSDFHRLSLPLYNDVPCSSANELHVGAQWAYMRAVVAQRKNDMPAAVCWLYVAAIQGDGLAAFYLSYCVHDGLGVQKDAAAAFQWATKSAENGSDYGAYMLASLYARGDGTSANPSSAQYWKKRGQELKIQKEKEAAADAAQEQQQRKGMFELAAMGIIGAAILGFESTQSELCEQDRLHNSDRDIAQKQERLRDAGQHCENGQAVPNR